MLEEKRYGEYFANGGMRLPEGSALTGKPITPASDIYVGLGPWHFVYVKRSEKERLAKADWAALKETWAAQFKDAGPADSEVVVASALPDLDAMTPAEVKKYADEYGVDLSGKRTQKQIVTAIRAHYAMQQFAGPAPMMPTAAPVAPETPPATEGSK